ncbi:MAG: hypothetical protein Q8K59_09935 [Nitrosomonas sp.]|nr:hypothetical protein [Nitrosomonas sp.]MDP1951393.1 hypothetical protein [Nitrosomonas sp.]
MVTKRGKQASRKAAARKYGFLEVPFSLIRTDPSSLPDLRISRQDGASKCVLTNKPVLYIH